MKENARMKTLADEWKQRDLEREGLLKRKIQEFTSLESTLKSVSIPGEFIRTTNDIDEKVSCDLLALSFIETSLNPMLRVFLF